MAMQRILIVGATSALAVAAARRWATQRAQFFLAGRNAVKLQQVAADLTARGAAAVHLHVLDLNRIAEHSAMLDACYARMGGVDIAVLAYGTLSDQTLCQHDVAAAMLEFETNAASYIALLTLIADRMETSGTGTIAVISSVAGDRGRASNYVYGAAKAAVTAYCEGLRLRLRTRGVHVLTIKPGPVATPMTAHLKLPPLLTASPETVGRDIVAAVRRRKSTLYTPWYWRPIMAVVRALPESILSRLPL